MKQEKTLSEKIIKTLKESKVTSKRWGGKWCYFFKEELEDYPEIEILLKKVIDREFGQFIKEILEYLEAGEFIKCDFMKKVINQKSGFEELKWE